MDIICSVRDVGKTKDKLLEISCPGVDKGSKANDAKGVLESTSTSHNIVGTSGDQLVRTSTLDDVALVKGFEVKSVFAELVGAFWQRQ